jgi:hypothetical protein
MTPIAPYITAFLREQLPRQRGASRHTCGTCAYAFKLLFEYASERLDADACEVGDQTAPWGSKCGLAGGSGHDGRLVIGTAGEGGLDHVRLLDVFVVHHLDPCQEPLKHLVGVIDPEQRFFVERSLLSHARGADGRKVSQQDKQGPRIRDWPWRPS